MKKKPDIGKEIKLSSKSVFALGTVLPFFIFFIAYAMIKVYPFGDKLLLPSDSFSQYFPFLTELKRSLSGGESLFYSFSGGLGYDFWSTIAYYAASPLNLLLLVIPESGVGDYMAWAIVLKVSLCGGVFAWYLYRQNSKQPLFAVAFGSMYACSGFFIGQKFNLMWLDSIALVPLVMLGLEKIVRRESPVLYLISLFFVIWCNYYIGFIVCLFSCLYLAFLLVIEENFEKKNLLRILPSFAVSSLLAGGLASLLLVPSYLALRNTRSVVNGENPGFRLYNNIISMLRAHYMESGFFRTSRNPGDVILYCGVIVLFLAALFFTEKKFSKKQRIGYGVFLGFLLLSFTFSPLNYLWHGFHNQNNVPNRFAFLYVLLLLKLCYSMLPLLKDVDEKRMNTVVLGVFAVSAVFFVWDLVGQHDFRVTLSFAFLMLYTVLLFEIRSGNKKNSKTKVYSLVLCVLLIVEAGAAVLIDTSLNGEGRVRSEVLNWQKEYRQLTAEQNNPAFCRCEADSDEYNFVTLLGGNAVSLFNSTMQANICRFLDAVNVHTELNAVLCRTPAKLMADFLGIRYFITEETSAETWNGFEKVASADGKTLYENKNALSLGFMLPEDFSSWQPDKGDGMDGQNSLATLLTDVEEFYTLRETFSGESGVPVSFSLTEDEALFITLDEDLYEVTWETPEYSNTYESQFPNLLLAANSTEMGSTAVLTVTTIDDSSYTGKVFTCREEDYNRVLEALSANQLENVSVSGNHVSGSISADQTGILLMTIPYNTGWRISVDGAPSSYEEIAGALIGIPLEAGTHEVEMRYTPQGFTAGCIMSLLFLLLTGAYIFWQHKTRSPKSE